MGRRAWIMLWALASLWGASYLFIKVSLPELGPAGVVVARTALGALVLVPIALARGALAMPRERLGALVVLAVLQVAAPFLAISWGEERISLSLTGILVSCPRSSAPCWRCGSTRRSVCAAGGWPASRSASRGSRCCSAST
ncbi:MAG TPA: DMT family transporter [Solirubrobacteraceae bacterium]|nr:DMT family transporter [Solirubrobacteraceae bacterium]